MRVLIVEDQEDLAAAIAERLRKRGYAVDIAMDGSEADELLRCENYQLVVLDLILPGLDGQAVLHELRRRRSMTPVLVLTARSEVEDKVGMLDAGADDYLVKPFDFRELEARCRALLRRQRRRPSSRTGSHCRPYRTAAAAAPGNVPRAHGNRTA